MSVEEMVMRLPRIEKIRLMESLWADLSTHGDEMDSPSWHEGLLQQTEQRLAAGKEVAVDWEVAKRRIRGA